MGSASRASWYHGLGRALKRFGVLTGALLLLQGTSSLAAEEETFDFAVTVLHATLEGSVGEGARRFDRVLHHKVRYEGLRVVKSKRATLAANEIGSLKLPDGDTFRFRPIDPDGPGALVAIDSGTTQLDYRLLEGKLLFLGGSSWNGGTLWIVLELKK